MGGLGGRGLRTNLLSAAGVLRGAAGSGRKVAPVVHERAEYRLGQPHYRESKRYPDRSAGTPNDDFARRHRTWIVNGQRVVVTLDLSSAGGPQLDCGASDVTF